GEIAARQKKYDEAIVELKEAVRLHDALPYAEPPPWYYPTRQALGQVLLDAGRFAEARDVYREDLKLNPRNGWAFYGLAQSLTALGDSAAAGEANRNYEQAFSRADVKLSASRF